MNCVSPPPGFHPVYWALTHVVGFSERQVHIRANAPMAQVRRAQTGHSVDGDVVRRMAKLLRHGADKMLDDAPPRSELPPALRAYRAAVFAAVKQVVDDALRTPLVEVPSDPHTRQVLDAIGDGMRRDDALLTLRRSMSKPRSLRVARRAGVVERDVGGEVWWLPPPHASYPTPPRTPTAYRPKTARCRRLHDEISIALGRAGGQADGRKIVEDLMSRGHSRTAIFRAVRDMRVDRRTTGFGAERRSLWSLPGADEPQEETASDAPVTDFRHEEG